MKCIKYIFFCLFIIITISCSKKEEHEMSMEEFNQKVNAIKEKKKSEENCNEQNIYSQNYDNKNGTILFEDNKYGIKTTIRKFETEILIGELCPEKTRVIYSNYNNNRKIDYLKNNDIIKTYELCTIEYQKKEKINNIPQGEVWIKILKDDIDGWICIDSETIKEDYYYGNNYSITEKIITSNKSWTVHQLEGDVSVLERLNVRDKPGLSGKKIFLLHDYDEGTAPQTNVRMVSITEEKDIIDDIEDYWIKIEYQPGKYGWVFGGYVFIGRGGPKYGIPENIVKFKLGWY